MKNVIAIIGICISSIGFSWAQSDNQLAELLGASIDRFIASKARSIEENRGNPDILRKTSFLSFNFPVDFKLPSQALTYGIAFYNESQYRRSELKKGVWVLRLNPIQLNGSVLRISIVNVLVTRKGRHVNHAVGSGTDYLYSYSCEKKEWEFAGVK